MWFSGWDDELPRRLFPPDSLGMLQNTDKLFLFHSGTHLKVSLPLPLPTCDASGLSAPEEQQRVAVLPDQSALRLTEPMLGQDDT